MILSLTQTMLSMASRCAEQFRRRFIEGEIIPPNIAAIRGTALHKAASENHRHIQSKGEALSEESILDLSATAYIETLSNGVSLTQEEAIEKSKVLGKGKDETISLASLYSRKVSPCVKKPLLIETELSADVGLDIPLSGTVDLLHNGKTILDLKTASKSKPDSFGQNNLQATAYTILVQKEIVERPNFEFRVLVANKEPVEQVIPAIVSQQDERALLARMMVVLRMLETGLFPPTNPNEAWWCSERFCGYWSSCRYVGH